MECRSGTTKQESREVVYSMEAKDADWIWSAFDFLQSVKKWLQETLSSSGESRKLLSLYVAPHLLASRWSPRERKRLQHLGNRLKLKLVTLEREHPHFIKSIVDHQEHAGITHVLLPREASFPLHWSLFRTLEASTEEWEDLFRDLVTPFLMITPRSPHQAFVEDEPPTLSSSDSSGTQDHGTETSKLLVTQRILGRSFWMACQQHELSLTTLQQYILGQAISWYHDQFFQRTALPNIKELASTVQCHPNHVHRTLVMALSTGMISFQAVPHVFRLGGSMMMSIISEASPSFPHLLSSIFTPATELTDIESFLSQSSAMMTPWIIAPLNTRSWIVTWILPSRKKEDGPTKHLRSLLNRLDSSSRIIENLAVNSVFRWIDRDQYFGKPDVDDEQRMEKDNNKRKERMVTWLLQAEQNHDPHHLTKKLTKLQHQLLYLLQEAFHPVRALARYLDVEPSTVTRSLMNLKQGGFLLPNVVIRFARPVHPVLIYIRGLEVIKLPQFIQKHVQAVPGFMSGMAWTVGPLTRHEDYRDEEDLDAEGGLVLMTSVKDSRVPHALARRVMYSFDLPDDAITIYDNTLKGGPTPFIHPMMPHPYFFQQEVNNHATSTTMTKKIKVSTKHPQQALPNLNPP